MTRSDFRDITAAIYEAVSGPAGPRDYSEIRRHYLPEARLIRTGAGPDGRPFMAVMSASDHEADVSTLLADTPFEEVEIDHQAEIFGHVARVRSVYRFKYGEGSAARTGRGVNFFNFVFDGRDWKIASIVWDNERPGVALDAKS